MGVVVLLLVSIVSLTASLFGSEITLQAKVVDEDNAPIDGATVAIRPASPGINSGSFQAVSDATGAFTLTLPQPGPYLITAGSNGFFTLKDRPADLHDGGNEIVLALNHVRNTSETVNVVESSSPVDIEQTDSEKRLSGPQILDVPFPSTHDLRNALPLMPGVLQGPNGNLHFDGGAENQVLYTLDGFNISDPLTGTFNTHLSVEAVRSIIYESGRFSPEFGKGSSGAMSIRTETGDDQFRYSATNFVPGIDTKTGLHIGAFTPRANLSGPILKGRAWFSDNWDGNYNTTVVPDVHIGPNSTSSFSFSNLLHGQVNVSPGNILFADFLLNYLNAPESGLGALDPLSTTTDQRSRAWFTSIKDQIYVARGTLLEIGFADLRTLARTIPQGDGLYLFTPTGHLGNYYVDSTQHSERKQLLANLYLPPIHLGGTHQFKTGADLDRIDYSQQTARTGYENLDVSGNVIRKTVFGGSGNLQQLSAEASSYIVDAWRIRPNLQVEGGFRQDWDELVRRVLLSPRVSASYAPFGWKNTKISGGYAIVYDATQPQVFAQAKDQYSVLTFYNPDGTTAQGPEISAFTIPSSHLQAPRYQNWSLGAEQRLPSRLQLTLNLLRKRGTDGFTYVNTLPAGTSPPLSIAANYPPLPFYSLLTLTNLRRDSYDSAELTVHKAFGKSYEFMASYTRSRASSNSVVNLSVNQAALVTNNFGPVAWDSPNRLLSWGYLPTFWKNWAIAYLLEARDGFPFSVQQIDGTIVGQPDSYRLPFYFSLDLHAERLFHLRGYRFALRGGFNNITGHNNPTTVENTIGSPTFLNYYGSQGRHFVFRLRWLGKDHSG